MHKVMCGSPPPPTHTPRALYRIGSTVLYRCKSTCMTALSSTMASLTLAPAPITTPAPTYTFGPSCNDGDLDSQYITRPPLLTHSWFPVN